MFYNIFLQLFLEDSVKIGIKIRERNTRWALRSFVCYSA